jgi:hypothetical protein
MLKDLAERCAARPVDDRQVTRRIDRGDVAGPEPAFAVEGIAGAVRVA